IEYPETVMRDKIRVMTETLENNFGVKMLSHRAGRWAFNDVYASLLVEFGYKVDASITPHVSWKRDAGMPGGSGGNDSTNAPTDAYVIETPAGNIVEYPMTVIKRPLSVAERTVRSLLRRPKKDVLWLRPRLRNRDDLLLVLDHVTRRKRRYAQMMLHSS